MASIMSMEELPNFYKVNMELAPVPMVLRAPILISPTIKLKPEVTALLQPVSYVFTILAIKVAFCMVIICLWMHCRHMFLI